MTTPDHVMSADWWWAATSETVGKEWGRIEAKGGDGEIVASMPYQITRRGPFSAMLMPELTQTGHIRTSPDADRGEALKALIKALKAKMKSERTLMVQVSDYMTEADKSILREEGFELSERVSYKIKPEAAGEVESRLYPNKRRRYRRACGHFSLDESMTPAELYDEIEKAYVSVRYPRDLFLRLASTAIKNGNGMILRARASDGSTAASVFLALDSEAAYYLTPAINPAHKTDGANEWLTVQAIELVLSRGMTFDFEGSMVPRIAHSYRHYGGTPDHYTFATLYRPQFIKHIVRALTALKR